ncbi:hypothetical protein ACM91P_26975, partial [Klebsiella pneumoniae]
IKQVLRAYIFCGACGNNRTNRGGFQFAAARLPWFYRGNQASFARLTGVQPAQVTQWINKGFIVVNHTLYSPRRKLGI